MTDESLAPSSDPSHRRILEQMREHFKSSTTTKNLPHVPPSGTNESLRTILTSKVDLKEQFEALKSLLDGFTKAIEDELPSFISDVQAIVNGECGADQKRKLEQRRIKPCHKLNDKLGDSLSVASRLIEKMPKDVQNHAYMIYEEGYNLVDRVIDASMQIFSYILEGIVRGDLDDIEKHSKEVKQGIDAVNESIAALFDP